MEPEAFRTEMAGTVLSAGMALPPRLIWQCLETFLAITPGGRCAASRQWVGVRAAAGTLFWRVPPTTSCPARNASPERLRTLAWPKSNAAEITFCSLKREYQLVHGIIYEGLDFSELFIQ